MTLNEIILDFEATVKHLNALIEKTKVHYQDSKQAVEEQNKEEWREKIVAMANTGLTAPWSESLPNYCSRWVRQVIEHTYKLKDHALGASYFGASAIETGRLMRAKGIVLNKVDKYLPGDILLTEKGSGGAGHIGIYVGNGEIAENSVRRKGDARGKCDIKTFGEVTGVARIGPKIK